jgi:hypothetical protein
MQAPQTIQNPKNSLSRDASQDHPNHQLPSTKSHRLIFPFCTPFKSIFKVEGQFVSQCTENKKARHFLVMCLALKTNQTLFHSLSMSGLSSFYSVVSKWMADIDKKDQLIFLYLCLLVYIILTPRDNKIINSIGSSPTLGVGIASFIIIILQDWE